MSLSATVEGNTIVVNIPKPSLEVRENQVKVATKSADKTKIDIRAVRKDGMDELKKIKSNIPEDDFRRLSKEVCVLYMFIFQ